MNEQKIAQEIRDTRIPASLLETAIPDYASPENYPVTDEGYKLSSTLDMIAMHLNDAIFDLEEGIDEMEVFKDRNKDSEDATINTFIGADEKLLAEDKAELELTRQAVDVIYKVQDGLRAMARGEEIDTATRQLLLDPSPFKDYVQLKYLAGETPEDPLDALGESASEGLPIEEAIRVRTNASHINTILTAGGAHDEDREYAARNSSAHTQIAAHITAALGSFRETVKNKYTRGNSPDRAPDGPKGNTP